MANLVLSTGETILVDDADFESVKALSWHIAGKGYAAHAYRQDGKGKTLYLHTFLTGYKFIDHANRNKLDNRRENLRSSNESLNMANSSKRQGVSSKFKGVSWAAKAQKWIAYLGRDYLGQFNDEAEAASVYNAAAAARFGSHASLNRI
jgi:hypothetical protein